MPSTLATRRPPTDRDGEVAGWPLPALLRGARTAFAQTVRRALAEAGLDDLPPNGPYVVAAVSGTGAPLGSVIRQLGVSKQAGGQLVDALVVRGYLERRIDPVDRRRHLLRLTPRGEEAAAAVRGAVTSVERRLEERLGRQRVADARLVLAELVGGARAG
jgi:DNA-binding MarR family transcriptional regulator